MKILSFDEYVKINEGIPGDIAKRDLHGRTRKEDIIADKDELIERIKKEYDKQNSKTTHKLDLTMLDVHLVENMSSLFAKFMDLQSIDVSNWDVSNVKNMSGMFSDCKFNYEKEGNKLIRI